ncbi:aromatic-ring-hydroxylating dioxygenase subunit beta [Sphingobium sp. EM0848]|uniref:aromatic-ring-hydroxylating dioxygenase subunit beta n=1 Tax=Sphingobium sp. EM0848 TaxID=2743473 RepID=UPI00159C6623|nr:aromatic-ring-hydroxylating dioxygenase subunit beta [Sphingobium sp. EM0848]
MTDMEAFLIAQDFLAREAKLLDERRFEDWYAMLDDDIVYHVPIRTAQIDYAEEMAEGGYRIRDDKALIRIRIDRLLSGHAWAEVPPSRTLRLVGSLIVERPDPEIIAVESALILYRQRGHEAPGEVIPVRRQDELRITADGAHLFRRTALITEVVLSTPNLGIFL